MPAADQPSIMTLDRLERILRRDLKLGPDVSIGPGTALLGGEYDLDSLDVLLLLTSIEKEFHIKIPSDQVNRDSFSNLSALGTFVEQRLARQPS